MPASMEAELPSCGMAQGTLTPMLLFQPPTPAPAMQPGGTTSTVLRPRHLSSTLSESSAMQPWQAEMPGETRSSREAR